MINSSFVRFALVGLANTLVGYTVILLLHYGLGISPVLANTGGYLIGFLLSYGLNRSFTFVSKRPHVQALTRFGLAAACCFVLNLMVLEFSVSVIALPIVFAQALAVGSYTVAFYLSSRFFVFRA